VREAQQTASVSVVKHGDDLLADASFFRAHEGFTLTTSANPERIAGKFAQRREEACRHVKSPFLRTLIYEILPIFTIFYACYMPFAKIFMVKWDYDCAVIGIT
jgi:hypothetical protein